MIYKRLSFSILVLVASIVPAAGPAPADELELLMERVVIERREDLDSVVNDLVFLDSDEAAAAVASLLHDARPLVRAKAAWILGFLESPQTVGALRRAIFDPYWEVRRDAVYALGRLSAKETAPAVATCLTDSNREVRLEAARVLGLLGDSSTAPALREALAQESGDSRFEVALLTSLGAMNDPETVAPAKERLSSESEAVRLCAMRTLARLGDEEAGLEILRRLRHPEPHVRRDAALLLAEVPTEWSVKSLEAALEAEEESWVALAVAEALASQGGEAGLRHLAEVSASSSDARLSLEAAEALARLGIQRQDLSALRRRIALARMEAADLPPPILAADLLAFGLSFEERVLALSAHFRGAPYMSSPLGEGAGVDPGPLYRWDGVDCLTFVEQVLALAHLRHPDSLIPILIDLRYQSGQVSFGERNHLMEHQWLPNNAAKGWVRDITREVGGDLVIVAQKEISRESWESRRGVELALEADEIPLGTSSLPIIPLGDFPQVMDRVPEGAILVVVRDDFQSRPFRVTHLGFVVHKDNRPHLRHAARATYMSVIDEDLATFVQRNTAYRSWPVSGFHLLMPAENLDRADTLARMR